MKPHTVCDCFLQLSKLSQPSHNCQKLRRVSHNFVNITKNAHSFPQDFIKCVDNFMQISETLTKCAQRDTHERAALHITVPCARLRKIGRTFAKLFQMAVQKINDENRQRQSQRKEPTAQHHAFREQTHHAPSYALPRPPLIPPLVPSLRDVTACCVIRSTVAPCRQ